MKKLAFLMLLLVCCVDADTLFGYNSYGAIWENIFAPVPGKGALLHGTVGYQCPGSGSYDVVSLSAQIKSGGTGGGNFRCAIYNLTRDTLFAQHSAEISVLSSWNDTTWRGGSQGVTKYYPLTGGVYYRLIVSIDSSDVLVGTSNFIGTAASRYIIKDFTGGFPTPVDSGVGYSRIHSVRALITAACTIPTIAYTTTVCTLNVAFTQNATIANADSVKLGGTLPAGLSLTTKGANMGQITGTPTAVSSKTGYEIQALSDCDTVSTWDTLTVVSGLRLDSISPDTGYVGDTITVYGRNFGATKGTSTIGMGDSTDLDAVAWSNDSFSFIVPTLDTGSYDFIVSDGTAADTLVDGFFLNKVTITKLLKPMGRAGYAATTVGTGFRSGTATFKGPVTITRQNSDSIFWDVPDVLRGTAWWKYCVSGSCDSIQFRKLTPTITIINP